MLGNYIVFGGIPSEDGNGYVVFQVSDDTGKIGQGRVEWEVFMIPFYNFVNNLSPMSWMRFDDNSITSEIVDIGNDPYSNIHLFSQQPIFTEEITSNASISGLVRGDNNAAFKMNENRLIKFDGNKTGLNNFSVFAIFVVDETPPYSDVGTIVQIGSSLHSGVAGGFEISIIGINDNQFRIRIMRSGIAEIPMQLPHTPLNYGTKYAICVTVSNVGNIVVYLNGQIFNQSMGAYSFTASNSNMWGGGDFGNTQYYLWNGTLDEGIIFDYQLDEEMAKDLTRNPL